jgi:hypothetical protein
MHETLRQYAQERLDASRAANTTARRHADYYRTLAEQAEPRLRGADQLRWFRRLEAEHDNLRIALDCLLEQGSVDLPCGWGQRCGSSGMYAATGARAGSNSSECLRRPAHPARRVAER